LAVTNTQEYEQHSSFQEDQPMWIKPAYTSLYEIWEGRIGWTSDNWDVSLWGKNLTDEHYVSFSTGNFISNLFGPADNYNQWINEPRSLGATIRYRL
jgi:outer membrane receptor protein involved in Fe transport